MSRDPVAGPIVIPNTVEMKLHWSQDGRLFTNVFHGGFTGTRPVSPALAETIFSAIKIASSTATWLTLLHPSITLTGVSIKDLHSANQPTLPSSSAGVAGSGAGGPMPSNTALVATLRTAQAGQGFRGRVYLCGLTDASLASSRVWADTAGSAAVDFVEGIRTIMDSNTIPMGIAQRALNEGTHHDGSPWSARPAAFIDVISVDIANPRVDTQRRRLGR